LGANAPIPIKIQGVRHTAMTMTMVVVTSPFVLLASIRVLLSYYCYLYHCYYQVPHLLAVMGGPLALTAVAGVGGARRGVQEVLT
jgi:hypothetical protein